MYARSWVSLAAAVAAAAASAFAATPMKEGPPVRLLSTVTARYQMTQEGRQLGTETVRRLTFSNNTVELESEGRLATSGVVMRQDNSVTLAEDSHFPRTYRGLKRVEQPTDTLVMSFSIDMFANVAVVGSEVRGRTESRRVVVPTGAAVFEPGAVSCWYQVMPWVAAATERQRFQWIDPALATVESGEIYRDGEDTLTVQGKRITVTVFKAERERLGPATVYLDRNHRIVRCEQNMTTYELIEWSETDGEARKQ